MILSRNAPACRELTARARRRAPLGMIGWPAAGMLCACVLTLLTGCSGTLVGHWHMVEVSPNRQFFCIDDVTFGRSGSYTATTTVKGKTLDESGTYKFNGFKLTFQPDAGGRRQYDAMLKFNELEIIDAKQRVILRKD